MTTGQARPAEDAFRTALSEMVLWLEGEYGFPRGEAYLFLGQVLEARCTQFVNPTFSYVAKVNQNYLPNGQNRQFWPAHYQLYIISRTPLSRFFPEQMIKTKPKF